MLNPLMFNPHLKAILNDKDCPLRLHYLNNASKKFDAENNLPKSMGHFLNFFFKVMNFRHFSESPKILGNLTWNWSYRKSRSKIHVGKCSQCWI